MTQKVGGVEFDVDVDASGAVKAATVITSSNSDIEKSYERVEQATKNLPTALSRLSAQYSSSGSKLKEFIAQQIEAGRAIDENGNVVTAYGVKARGLTEQLTKLTSTYQDKKEKVDAVGAAVESLTKKTEEAQAAESAQKSTVDGLNTSLSKAAGEYSALSQGAAEMHEELQKSNSALANAIARQISLGNSVDKSNRVIDKNGNELQDATAALQKYAAASHAANSKVNEASAAFSQMTKRSKTAFNNISQNAGMAGIQIQQFVGQIQGGQSAMLALSQQGADLGFVLGRAGLGAAIGIAATALSFLIPALTGAEEETGSLRDRIKELGDEITLTANQIKYLGSQNSKEADKLADANVKAFDKVRELREELEKMQSAGIGLDVGDFAVPRSAEENQRRYADSIEETEEEIDKLLTTIDTNSQNINKLAEDTTKLGKETEKASSNAKDHTTALQAQIIAMESGAQAAEVYAATQSAVANGTEDQLPKVIELINRKYELKAAQEAAAESAKAEIAQQKAYSSILDEIFAKEEARKAQKALEVEQATSNLAAFEESLMSEEQLRAQAYTRELEQLKASAEALGMTKDEIRELEKQKANQHAIELMSIEESRAAKEKALEEKKAKDKLSVASKAFGNLSTLMNTESRKMFEIGKIAATAGAIIDGIAAVQGAFKVGNKIGGPPLGAAFAATAAAGALVQVKQIQSTQFGSRSAGQSFQGGQLTTNTSQQQPEQRNVSIALTGSSFSGGDIRGLISAINEELGDGVTLSATGG